ncbi:MAG: hypothetical protein ACK5VF_02380 [Bacteroidota bacterium]
MRKIILLLFISSLSHTLFAQSTGMLQGAWVREENEEKTLILIIDQLISVAVYNEKDKKFLYTWGGAYVLHEGQLQLQYEWSSKDSNLVNTSASIPFIIKGNKLSLGENLTELERGPAGPSGDLQGVWIISGTYTDGVLNKRPNPFLPRRTMKLIVGDYFQWVSYNVVTKKFFDAGGGRQTHVKGAYSEEIEYFTKATASIGKKMTFTYAIDGDGWRHSGKKSTGGQLDECWTRRSRIESSFKKGID